MKQTLETKRRGVSAAARPNLTGIPVQMKQEFERRSGLSLDDVRVHYSSGRPAKLGALAYTQGTQVYMGPGQERHLPHELGHVIQQKRGLVRPDGMLNGLPVNRSPALERDADAAPAGTATAHGAAASPPVVQGVFENGLEAMSDEEIWTALCRAYQVPPDCQNHVKELRASPASCSSIDDIASGLRDAGYDVSKKTEIDMFEDAMKELYAQSSQRPNRVDMIHQIEEFAGQIQVPSLQIADDEHYIKALERAVRAGNEAYVAKKGLSRDTLEKTRIESAAASSERAIPGNLGIDQFVIRHYTPGPEDGQPPAFTTIRSNLSLQIEKSQTPAPPVPAGGRRRTDNTNSMDWNTFGNVGSTFFVLVVGGHPVSTPGCVKSCKYYAEVPLREIQQSVWFSSDWLNVSEIRGTAYEGTPQQVHRKLIDIVYEAASRRKEQGLPSASDELGMEIARLERQRGEEQKLSREDEEYLSALQGIWKAQLEDFQQNAQFLEQFDRHADINPADFASILGNEYHSFEIKVRGPVDISRYGWKRNAAAHT